MFLILKGLEDYMLPCLTKKAFGFDCMGCGLQRSVALLIKGQFIEAFIMYPAVYPLIFLFIFLIFDKLYTLKHSEKTKLGLATLTLIAAVTNYILKTFIN